MREHDYRFLPLGIQVSLGNWEGAGDPLVLNSESTTKHGVDTVWGVIYQICRQLSSKTTGGLFTRKELQEAIVRHDWSKTRVLSKYPRLARSQTATAEQVLTFVGWAATITHEVEHARFACAKRAI